MMFRFSFTKIVILSTVILSAACGIEEDQKCIESVNENELILYASNASEFDEAYKKLQNLTATFQADIKLTLDMKCNDVESFISWHHLLDELSLTPFSQVTIKDPMLSQIIFKWEEDEPLEKNVSVIDSFLDWAFSRSVLTSRGKGVDGLGIIAEKMKENTSVLELILRNTGCLRQESALALKEMLTVNHSLTVLDLAGNHINSKTADYLWEGLRTNKIVTSLNLEKNNIQLTKAAKISLTNNKTLTFLNLSNNKIERESIHYLVKIIRMNRGLQIVKLEDNQLDHVDVMRLIYALRLNDNTLTSLNIEQNRVSEDHLSVLKLDMEKLHFPSLRIIKM